MKAENELSKKEHLLDLQLSLRKSLFNRLLHIEDIESKALALCNAIVDFEETIQIKKDVSQSMHDRNEGNDIRQYHVGRTSAFKEIIETIK